MSSDRQRLVALPAVVLAGLTVGEGFTISVDMSPTYLRWLMVPSLGAALFALASMAVGRMRLAGAGFVVTALVTPTAFAFVVNVLLLVAAWPCFMVGRPSISPRRHAPAPGRSRPD